MTESAKSVVPPVLDSEDGAVIFAEEVRLPLSDAARDEFLKVIEQGN